MTGGARLKMLGHTRVLDAREHPELLDALAPKRFTAEQAENMPRHSTPASLSSES